jgi:nitrate reductase gamma subunit
MPNWPSAFCIPLSAWTRHNRLMKSFTRDQLMLVLILAVVIAGLTIVRSLWWS